MYVFDLGQKLMEIFNFFLLSIVYNDKIYIYIIITSWKNIFYIYNIIIFTVATLFMNISNSKTRIYTKRHADEDKCFTIKTVIFQ